MSTLQVDTDDVGSSVLNFSGPLLPRSPDDVALSVIEPETLLPSYTGAVSVISAKIRPTSMVVCSQAQKSQATQKGISLS